MIGATIIVPAGLLGKIALVTPEEGRELLEKFRSGAVNADAVLRSFQAEPVAEFSFAQVDTHRALRKGFPEVIFGGGRPSWKE